MGIRIAARESGRHRWRHLRQAVTAAVGRVFVALGLLAASVPVVYVVAVIAAFLIGEHRAPPLVPKAAMMLAVASLVSGVGLWGGLRLIRGERHLVLFLRRFGFTDATEVVSFAVATALAGRWRLVTLDDTSIAPIGVARGAKRLSLLWLSAGLMAAAAGSYWVFGGGAGHYVSGVFGGAMKGPPGEGLREFFGRLIGAMLISVVVGGLMIGLVLLVVSFSGAAALFSWRSYAAIRRAEQSRALAIEEEPDIDRIADSIEALSGRLFAPRLTVVRVANRLWKRAVESLVARSAVVLVDVSEPTESLLWELHTLMRRPGSRWVLIGLEDRVKAMTARPSSGRVLAAEAELQELLKGEEVVAYTGRSHRQMRRFGSLLRERLEDLH